MRIPQLSSKEAALVDSLEEDSEDSQEEESISRT
jgi:hypothetical protein